MNIAFTENTHPGTLPPSDQLGFGSVFTDHMFLMDYSALRSHLALPRRQRPALRHRGL